MEHTTATPTPNFKRKARIGMSILYQEINQTVYVKILKYDIFISKNYPEGIPYFDVINLHTGEETRMWIDGGMKGQLSSLGTLKDCEGHSLEITKKEKVPFEYEDETGKKVKTDVNSYEIFELDA